MNKVTIVTWLNEKIIEQSVDNDCNSDFVKFENDPLLRY